jgi:hypothetical protein
MPRSTPTGQVHGATSGPSSDPRSCSVCGYRPGAPFFASDVIGGQRIVTRGDLRRIVSRLWRAVDAELHGAAADAIGRHFALDVALRDHVHAVVDEAFDALRCVNPPPTRFDVSLRHNDRPTA